MKELDLISVIIPVYNVEKYVRQTLDSILNQTYKNLEILVVDDGSTDNSGKICDEYLKDKRVKVFHIQNSGVASARQFGFKQIKGKYFVTIDSDDFVSEDFLECLYETIVKNSADVSICGVNIFNDGKDNFNTAFLPSFSIEKLITTSELLKNNLYALFNQLLLSDSWNKMYKTEFVKNAGVKFELNKIYNGSDLKFNMNLVLYDPIYCFCNKAMVFHRIRTNSKVTRKNKQLQEGFEIIIESIINTAKVRGLSLTKEISKIYYWLIGNAIFDVMVREKSRHEVHRKFKTIIRENKLFLKKHKEDLKKFRLFRRIKLGDSKIHLPALCLSSTVLLDVASFLIINCKKILSKRRK